MRAGLLMLLILFCVNSQAQQTIIYSALGDSNDPDARRYEVARIYIDAANWNWTGTTEFDLHEKLYSGGLKKTYIISYGYNVQPVCFLKDISGEGANNFKITLGSEVTVSGSIKYLSVYVDLKYYAVVNIALRTNWHLTTNSSNTSQGYLYYNQSPSYSSIPNFNSDDTVYFSNRAFNTILAGNVGIGTAAPSEKLSVNGKIRAKEVKVEATNWPDYVFDPSYRLPDLKVTEQFIKENKHLPEMPSAAEVEKEGINLGEMNARLLKKIEEMTLYLIAQNKAQAALINEVSTLKSKITYLESKP